jgi:hypothetical protein
VGFAPVAARRAVSSWVLGGGGAEVGIGRTARAGVGAAPAGIAASFVVEAARRSTAGCDSGVGVRGAFRRGGGRHRLLRGVLLRDTVRCHSRLGVFGARNLYPPVLM